MCQSLFFFSYFSEAEVRTTSPYRWRANNKSMLKTKKVQRKNKSIINLSKPDGINGYWLTNEKKAREAMREYGPNSTAFQ